jgi:hypothetical protein
MQPEVYHSGVAGRRGSGSRLWQTGSSAESAEGYRVLASYTAGVPVRIDHPDRLQIGPRHGFSKRLWSWQDEVLPSL